MQARRSYSPTLRRVAFTAALAALLLPAGQAEAKKTPKKPVVTSVKPMKANIGDTITIYGRNFIKGKSKNTIAFRRDGAKTVFVRGDVATLRQIRVTLPETLAPFLQDGTFTKFRLRVLARRFGKSFTPLSKSPSIGPALVKPDGTPVGPPGSPGNPVVPPPPTGNDDCDEDKVLNKDDADDDNDLLEDSLEKTLMTDACSKDSDGDGVEDGFEYKSAIDLNDDEYQQPNKALPYPGQKPYPNPLFADSGADWDRDRLDLKTEFELWRYSSDKAGTAQRTLFPLSYSDGMQYSVHGVCKVSGNPETSPCSSDPNSAGRRYPTLEAGNYERWFGPDGFYTWAARPDVGYEKVVLYWYPEKAPYYEGKLYDIRDVDLSDGLTAAETAGDAGTYLSDDERDEDADGLSNLDEISSRMTRKYWETCYGLEAMPKARPGEENAPLSPFDADSDGDGVRDGADDLDHDDFPNIMELSRKRASGFDDTDDGSTPPQVPEGQAAPPPTVGGGPDCKLDKELPPKGEEGEPAPMWHGPGAYGRVNPFNPCLPWTEARTCPRVIDPDDKFTPMDESQPSHQWFSLQ
jgi:hypothetical protein